MPKLFDKKVVSMDSRMNRRFRSFSLFKYSIASDPAQKRFLVNARDISAGGASFISDVNLPVNAVLEADIYLPPLKDFITVMANVVRAAKIKEKDQYLIGVRFKAIDPADKGRINSYIENMAKDSSMHRYLDRKGQRFKRVLQ